MAIFAAATQGIPPGRSPGDVPRPSNPSPAEAQWQENLNVAVMCPDCKEMPPNLIEAFSSGDMVCGSCGLVLGDRIVDTRSEWRTFSNDDQGNDDPSRVGEGANPLLNGSQLQTAIVDGGSGRSRDLNRAQNKSNHDKGTKGLLAAYKEIGAFCDAINIPKNVSDTAKHLYKLVDDAKAFKGKPQDVLSAGCIFIACRQCGVPRTFREVFAVTKVQKKEIGRIFKALEKFFAAQNKEKMEQMIQKGGMSFPAAAGAPGRERQRRRLTWRACALQQASSTRTTRTRPRLRPRPSSSASATAATWVCRPSVPRFRRSWPSACPRWAPSPDARPCRPRPLAST